MARKGYVELTKPDGHGTRLVHPSEVRTYTRRGWTEGAKPKPKRKRKKTTTATTAIAADQALADPADSTG